MKLTSVEQEIMDVLWNINGGTVHDVLANLPTERPLAYTSVSTMLRILQQKGAVEAVKKGRQHIYQPVIDKSDYTKSSVKKLISELFSGNPLQLVAHLLDKNKLSKNEIDEIQKLLNSKKKELSQ